MSQNSPISKKLPPEISGILLTLGERIKIARKRRRLTMSEMASRMFITRKTLSRLENGDPGIALSILASALWVLGLEKDLLEIAAPERDKIGIFKEKQELPQRIRKTRKIEDLDF